MDTARTLDTTALHARLADDLVELADGVEEAPTPRSARLVLAQGLQVIQERLCDLDAALAVTAMLDHPAVPDRTRHSTHPYDPTAPLTTARLEIVSVEDEVGANPVSDGDRVAALWSPVDVAPPRVTRVPWVLLDDTYRVPPVDARVTAQELTGRLLAPHPAGT